MLASVHHSFDIALAVELKSIDLAILIHHFQFWIAKNRRMGRNQYEGRTWTYHTLQEIAATFPYWSIDQVNRLLRKAVKLKILKKGNFNKSGFDRTTWYAFENEEKFGIWRFRQMDFAVSPNGNGEIARPIPDTIPDIESIGATVGSGVNKERAPRKFNQKLGIMEAKMQHNINYQTLSF